MEKIDEYALARLALQRADVVVLTAAAQASDFPLQGKMVWRAPRGILPPKDVPHNPVAFCGIARPESFFVQLRMSGIGPAAEASYGDHHQYTEADIRELLILPENS